jgi:hypothetical protein
MALNFGPPVLDFKTLSGLGKTFDDSREEQAKHKMNAARQGALSALGSNQDLTTLGQTLLRSGDLEGGLQALRMAEAQKSSGAGQSIQREQLAETIRAHRTEEQDRAAERERIEAQRSFQREQANRPERVTGQDKYDNPREGLRDPRTGVIKWEDGSTTSTTPGPQSSLSDAPASGAMTAQMTAQPREPGFFIPSTGQVLPPGTELPPGRGGAAATAPAPRQAEMPVPGAMPVQAAPPPNVPPQAPAPPPPPAQAPGAVAPQDAQTAAPSSALMRGSENVPAMSMEDMYQESQRLGLSMKQYRAIRAKQIEADMMGKVPGAKPLTEAQDKAQIGARRMEGAEREFRPLSDVSQSLSERAKANTPFGIGQYWASDEYKGAEASKREWIEGFLRPVSGATILPSEYENYDKIYFPQLGDSPAVVAQKARARERALQGVKAGLPAETIAKMERGQKPLEPAPGEAGDLKSGAPAPLKVGGPPRNLGGGRSITKIAD